MAETVRELITRAWYLSGIVGRSAQPVTGEQISDGLYLLNALLDRKSIQIDLIPYYEYDDTLIAVPGQEKYFIQNCIDIDVSTFNIGVVRYPMDYVPRNAYFGAGRVDNIESLPFSWTFNRVKGGLDLYMYFLPAGEYPIKLMAKFALTDVTLDQDLTAFYDGYYIEYLRYCLADYMCTEYGVSFSSRKLATLKDIEAQLRNTSAPDLTVEKISILVGGSPLNFGDVNIGHYYRPS